MDADTPFNHQDFVSDRDAFVLKATTDIVCSALNSGRMEPGQLGSVIQEVHGAVLACLNVRPEALADVFVPQAPVNVEPQVEPRTPEQIAASITDEHLISFEDGKPYKTLKRSLTTRGMTPESYRAKWGLPKDYPMVAPNYAAQRSALAKSIGLGRRDQPEAELPR